MNRRPQPRNPLAQNNGKSSFGVPRQNRQSVHQAIDESLHTVRFTAQDMRTVMQAAQTGKKSTASKKKRRTFRPDLIFTVSFMLLIALPASIYAIRARESMTTITLSPGQETTIPHQTTQSNADIIATPESTSQSAPASPSPSANAAFVIDESEATQIARECFEAQCDTSIFTFEEYTVSTQLDMTALQYTVKLSCIYENGCHFTVVLSADTGSVIQYSSPTLATVPTSLDNNSPHVRAWFIKHGEFMFTWPQDVQAEFSRRYQGGTLRNAREGEISAEEAIAAVSAPIKNKAPDLFTAFYPVLYSERASDTGRAYYLVYCYPEEISDTLPSDEPMIVAFDAQTGDILDITGNPLDE